MTIPSKADWGKIDKHDLDARCAFKQFAGKSLSAAEEMFKENALYYQEDLLSMPAVAFNYYAPVFARYIISDDAQSDSDGASSYLHMIIELLHSHRQLASEATLGQLLDAAKIVSTKQDFYEADNAIYGDFSQLYQQILTLYEKQ